VSKPPSKSKLGSFTTAVVVGFGSGFDSDSELSRRKSNSVVGGSAGSSETIVMAATGGAGLGGGGFLLLPFVIKLSTFSSNSRCETNKTLGFLSFVEVCQGAFVDGLRSSSPINTERLRLKFLESFEEWIRIFKFSIFFYKNLLKNSMKDTPNR
jgi:hypothetical protein